MSMVAMQVVGVRIEMPSNQPIVLLKEIDGVRFLPIWVGAVEATAIAFAQQGVIPPRPLTHDLMQDIVESLDATLTAVQVTAMEEGIFMASFKSMLLPSKVTPLLRRRSRLRRRVAP